MADDFNDTLKDSRNQWKCKAQIKPFLSFGPELNHLNQAVLLLFIDVLELLTAHLGGATFYLCHLDIKLEIKKPQTTVSRNNKKNNIIIFILQDLI